MLGGTTSIELRCIRRLSCEADFDHLSTGMWDEVAARGCSNFLRCAGAHADRQDTIKHETIIHKLLAYSKGKYCNALTCPSHVIVHRLTFFHNTVLNASRTRDATCACICLFCFVVASTLKVTS